MNIIKDVYKHLCISFGPQGLWPVTVKGSKPTYNKDIELTDRQRFEIIIGAILTQYIVSC